MNKNGEAKEGITMSKNQKTEKKDEKIMSKIKLTKDEKIKFFKYWKSGIYKQLHQQNLISDMQLMQLLEKSDHC